MNKVIRVVDRNLNENNLDNIDRYIREKMEIERQQKIAYLLELIRNNPDITEQMVGPELSKYLGIAMREYKKEIILKQGKTR